MKETNDNETTNCDKCYKENKQGGLIQYRARVDFPLGRVIRKDLSEEVIFKLRPEARCGLEFEGESPEKLIYPLFRVQKHNFYNLCHALCPNI